MKKGRRERRGEERESPRSRYYQGVIFTAGTQEMWRK
jgi:hypothetical protein